MKRPISREHWQRKVWFLCLLSLSFLAACGAVPVPSGPEVVLDPGQTGPYKVGVMTLRLTDPSRKHKGTENPRPMVIEIWYPAVVADDAAKDKYDVTKDSPPETQKAIAGENNIPIVEQNAYRDAKLDKSGGPYPLILYSHGSGGIRFQSIFYTPHLASHGYVVAAIDHEDNTLYNILAGGKARDTGVLLQSAQDRPRDVLFLHELLKQKNLNPDDSFFGMIQTDNVGITGHSFGGFTSLATLKYLKEIKVSIPQTPFTTGVAALGIKADDLADVPIMVQASKNDLTLDYQEEQKGYYEKLIEDDYYKAARYLLTLETGGHATYSNLCTLNLAQYWERFGFSSPDALDADGCSDKNIAPAEAHAEINKYATALFNVILRKSEGTRKYLIDSERNDVSFASMPAK